MITLYHFTSSQHYDFIKTEGLTRGDIPVTPFRSEVGIWLTTEPTADKDDHGLQGSMFDKTEVRIAIDFNENDKYLWHWPVLAKKLKVPDFWYDALNEAGGGKADTWYVYAVQIPPERFKEVLFLNEVKTNPMTKDAKDFISKKISQLIHEGYEISQAIAIAYSEARDRGFHVPEYEKENPTSFVEKAALKKIRDVALEISKKYKKIEFTNISVESGTNPETNEEEKFIRIEGSYLDGKGFAISQFGLDEVLQTPFDDLLAHYSNEILKELKETMQGEDINSPEFKDLLDSIIDKITTLYNRSTLLNDFKKGDDYIRSKLDREHKVNLLKKDIPILSARIAEQFIEVRGIDPEDQFDQFSMNQECVFVKARGDEYTILEFPKAYKDMPEKYEMPIEFFVYMIFFECIEAFRKRPDLFHLKLSE